MYPDGGWCDFDDLWGITIDGMTCRIQKNPKVKKPRGFDAVALLDNYGLTLSTNPKTVVCFNTLQEYTCWMSEWCKETCYGWSINFRNTVGYRLFRNNVQALFTNWSDQVIRDIAVAIKEICKANGLDNIRWHGIGDLVGRGIEIDLIDALTVDDDFVVWGFTRKGNVLQKVPVRDNIVFWCSMDPSMVSTNRLEVQVEAAKKHGTMLAYATHIGDAYGSRSIFSHYNASGKRRSKPMPPWQKPKLIKKPSVNYAPGPDPFLESLYAEGVPVSVVFGYHASGRLTHVGVPDECPGTDPLAGGHFLGTCLECGWCLQKPHKRAFKSLKENRKKWVNADSFEGKNFGQIWLDDGHKKR